ncbi:hypothetical protein [uncultured Tateyamaria sp.]|uniref:hypothetical protein n=1 Tax=uncultured Tateyamaria sp. TaxID=455651 RepID=UPI0026345A08|nr:hypothetical protein [uncultured Tateyamaria sp.]
MSHLDPFRARTVLSLPAERSAGWQLKRYAILADGRAFSEEVATAATAAAIQRLPQARPLSEVDGNHGMGFQLIHFAETAVVSPAFYWQWGSVLAHIDQLRAPWDDPTRFDTGSPEVFGCVWEMEIVTFEVGAWTSTMLSDHGAPADRLQAYTQKVAA